MKTTATILTVFGIVLWGLLVGGCAAPDAGEVTPAQVEARVSAAVAAGLSARDAAEEAGAICVNCDEDDPDGEDGGTGTTAWWNSGAWNYVMGSHLPHGPNGGNWNYAQWGDYWPTDYNYCDPSLRTIRCATGDHGHVRCHCVNSAYSGAW